MVLRDFLGGGIEGDGDEEDEKGTDVGGEKGMDEEVGEEGIDKEVGGEVGDD